MKAIDTTEGPLLARSVHLAWPAVLQAILVNFYAFNDFFFVGLLGDKAATAALSACFALLIVNYTLVRIVPTGGTTLIAQYTGARRTSQVGAVFRQALVAGLIWAGIVGVSAIAAMDWLVALNNVTPAVGERIETYLTVLMWGAPAFALMFAVDGTFRARGNTRVPLVLESFSLVLNGVLNWVLVLGNLGAPELGILGAAIATTVSRAVPGVVGIVLVFRGVLEFRPQAPLIEWIPRIGRVRRMARIGFFDSMGGMFYGIVYLVLNRMAGEIGPAAQGGLGAGLRGIEWIAFAFGDGFLTASVTIVGQNVGARKLDRAMKGAWVTAGLSALSCQLVGLAFLLAPEALSALVTDDPQTLAYAAEYVHIIGWVMWAIGLEMAFYGAFIGAGRTHITFLVSGVANLARIPLAAGLLFGVDAIVSGTLWGLFGLGTAPVVTGGFAAIAWAIAFTAVVKALFYLVYLAIRRRID